MNGFVLKKEKQNKNNEQNGWRFEDIFNCILHFQWHFLNEEVWILNKISLKLIDDKSSLIQVVTMKLIDDKSSLFPVVTMKLIDDKSSLFQVVTKWVILGLLRWGSGHICLKAITRTKDDQDL